MPRTEDKFTTVRDPAQRSVTVIRKDSPYAKQFNRNVDWAERQAEAEDKTGSGVMADIKESNPATYNRATKAGARRFAADMTDVDMRAKAAADRTKYAKGGMVGDREDFGEPTKSARAFAREEKREHGK